MRTFACPRLVPLIGCSLAVWLAACDSPGERREGLAEPQPETPANPVTPGLTPPAALAVASTELLGPILPGRPVLSRVAVDDAGRGLVVWQHYRDEAPYHAIFAAHHDGSSWSEAELIDGWSAEAPRGLALARAPGGDAVAVWHADVLMASRFVPGTGWSPPRAIHTPQQGHHTLGMKLAIAEDGTAVLVHAAGESSQGFDVRAQVGQPDGTWSEAVIVAARVPVPTYGDAGFAVDLRAEQVAVVWLAREADGVAVHSVRGHLGDGQPARWDPSERHAAGLSWVDGVWAVVDRRGGAFVGWNEHVDHADGSLEMRLVGVRAAAAAGPFGPHEVVALRRPDQLGWIEGAISLAGNADGELLVAWRRVDEPAEPDGPLSSSVRALTRDPAHGWSEEIVVADGLAPPYLGCALPPSEVVTVELDGEGRGLVAWHERDPESYSVDVLARTRDATGAWSEVRALASPESWTDSLDAALGRDGGVLLWRESSYGPDGDYLSALAAARLVTHSR